MEPAHAPDPAPAAGPESAKYSGLFVFSGGHKAGMQDMDKEKQAEVIYEMSKNTAYFKRATQLDEQSKQRAISIEKSFAEAHGALTERLQRMAESKMVEWERKRSFSRICCVLDMDMFFAAVEIRDQPHLKDLPVAVGGDAMISTSNYVARKFGVRAAMPGFIAKKLCPNLVFVKSNFDKYRKVAEQIRAVIAEYDPTFESYSLDEVYFDLTDAARTKVRGASVSEALDSSRDGQESEESDGEPGEVRALRAAAWDLLQQIRARITVVTAGLTCSAGIANNFTLAKICADINKPDGQFELPPSRDAVMQFVENLSTRRMPGIGKVSEKMLEQLGMKTMGDVRRNLAKVLHGFAGATGEFLLRAAMGVTGDEGQVRRRDATHMQKSIGCERTFSVKGVSDLEELRQKLRGLCASVVEDMAAKAVKGGRVTVKVKDPQFQLFTRCRALPHATNSAEVIETAAWELLLALGGGGALRVRLLGVAMSRLQSVAPSSQLEPQTGLLKFLSGAGDVLALQSQCVPDGDASPIPQPAFPMKRTRDASDISLFVRRGAGRDKVVDLTSNDPNSFRCPSCDANCSGLSALNQHLDRCLAPSPPPPPPAQRAAGSQRLLESYFAGVGEPRLINNAQCCDHELQDWGETPTEPCGPRHLSS